MTGTEVKAFIISNGLKLWEVANALGMNDGNFSRRLRFSFTDDEVASIEKIVKELKTQKTA